MADMRKIRLNFSSLQEKIWKSVDDIQGLVRLVLGMSILSEDDEKQIRQTPTDVSTILTKYWSFLDFVNLEHIVEEKCSNAEKMMVKEYKEEVQQFCKTAIVKLLSYLVWCGVVVNTEVTTPLKLVSGEGRGSRDSLIH